MVTPETDLPAMVAMPPAVAPMFTTVIMAHALIVVAHALVLLHRRRAWWRSPAWVIGLGLGDGCAGE